MHWLDSWQLTAKDGLCSKEMQPDVVSQLAAHSAAVFPLKELRSFMPEHALSTRYV